MLFPRKTLTAIATGQITVAFRRWRRPTVKAGGTLQTAIGVLAIERLEEIGEKELTAAAALAAGYPTLDVLRKELAVRPAGTLYRITFRLAGEDPRIALRERAKMSSSEWLDITRKLALLDTASRHGEWTTRVLDWIARHPGTRAGELAAATAWEKEWLKIQIRKLKTLGLTETLSTGYRLSPRGASWMERR